MDQVSAISGAGTQPKYSSFIRLFGRVAMRVFAGPDAARARLESLVIRAFYLLQEPARSISLCFTLIFKGARRANSVKDGLLALAFFPRNDNHLTTER